MCKQYLLTGIILFIIVIAASAQKLSDSDLKTNITDIPAALENIVKLEPKIFDYRTEKRSLLYLPSGRQYGFMSENVEAVFPGIVASENKSIVFGKNNSRSVRIKSINTENLIPVLVASIKELKSEIDFLKQEIEQLKKTSN